MRGSAIWAKYIRLPDIKHPRVRTSAYGQVEARSSWSISQASGRPQGRWSVHFPCSCLRFQWVPWSGSCLVASFHIWGISWYFSWPWSLLHSKITTCSLSHWLGSRLPGLDLPRARPAFPFSSDTLTPGFRPSLILTWCAHSLTSDPDVPMNLPCFHDPNPNLILMSGVLQKSFFQGANADSYSSCMEQNVRSCRDLKK